jgi:hypothetical protein
MDFDPGGPRTNSGPLSDSVNPPANSSSHPQSSLSSRTPFTGPAAKQNSVFGDRDLNNERELRRQHGGGSQRETLGGNPRSTNEHNASGNNSSSRLSTIGEDPRQASTVPLLNLDEADEGGAESPGTSNQYRDQYATNNPPLLIRDNMADTIADHPIRDTDWSDIFTGKRVLLFYDPSVLRAGEDLTISKKFTGDVAYWPEFKAVVHSNINLKRYMNWGEKCSQLIKYLGPPALEHCDWSDRTREGYIMALHTLEREFGGFDKLESALYNKLSTIRRISADPQSLHTPKMILRQILKINSAVGCSRQDKLKAERLFFDRLRWEAPEENAFLQFLLARGASQESAALFEDWAGGSQKLFRARIARTCIEDSAKTNKQSQKADRVLTSAKVKKMLLTRTETLKKKWKNKADSETEEKGTEEASKEEVANPCKRAKTTPECLQHKEAVAEARRSKRITRKPTPEGLQHKEAVTEAKKSKKIARKTTKGQVPARVRPKRAVKKTEAAQE